MEGSTIMLILALPILQSAQSWQIYVMHRFIDKQV